MPEKISRVDVFLLNTPEVSVAEAGDVLVLRDTSVCVVLSFKAMFEVVEQLAEIARVQMEKDAE